MNESIENELRMQAAQLGPGYKGERRQASPDERTNKAQELQNAWREHKLPNPPAYLSTIHEEQNWRDRKAKLFEIGEYEDKSLSIGESDLQRLEQTFDLPVPILIEHSETPLRLGYLTEVKAVGGELFGTLALTPEADDLLEASGAKSLSLSVSRELDAIYEVSIVSNPRIESARLFCSDFSAPPHPGRAELSKLKQTLEQLEIENEVSRLVATGKIPQTLIESFGILLRHAKRNNVESELSQLVDILPSRVSLGEIVPANLERHTGLTAEEEQFYRENFAGIDLKEIARQKEA